MECGWELRDKTTRLFTFKHNLTFIICAEISSIFMPMAIRNVVDKAKTEGGNEKWEKEKEDGSWQWKRRECWFPTAAHGHESIDALSHNEQGWEAEWRRTSWKPDGI
jgi:hypothetical protein